MGKRHREDETDAASDTARDADLEVPFEDVSRLLLETIRREGVAIVTGVIGTAEVRELEAAFADDLSELVDSDAVRSCADPRVAAAHASFEREGPRRFPYATVSHLAPDSAGFLLRRCVSHGRFAWRVRSHPRVHEVFGALHPNVGPLVSSLDATFFTPEGSPEWQHDRKSVHPSSAHVDQNQHDDRADLGECTTYQGVLYVWPSTDESTTTVVWPRSHLSVWPRMMESGAFVERGAHGVHYCPLSDLGRSLEAELMDGWQRHGRRLRVPAGALLLWNSRTVHAGWRGAGARLAQVHVLGLCRASVESTRVEGLSAHAQAPCLCMGTRCADEGGLLRGRVLP